MLANTYILNSQSLNTSGATGLQPLGSKGVDQIDRAFRYSRVGGSTLVVGNLLQAAAVDANFQDIAVEAAVAAGATTIPVTLGASATTASQFQDGVLTVSVAPGLGQSFHIIAHDVAASGTCNFYVEEPVQVALTTSSKVTVAKNPWADVIQAPTAQTGIPVGGATFAVVNAQFGWVQVFGQGTALADATATSAAGMALSQSVTTAGAVTKQVAAAPSVGFSLFPATLSAKTEPIFWTIG